MSDSSQTTPNPPPFQVYHLAAELAGHTLASALKELASSTTSWGTVKDWIARRCVEVNGNLCLDPARRLGQGDVIKVWRQPRPKPIETNDIRIAYLDQHLLVVEKPAGVTSVRHVGERDISVKRRQLQPTLEELLPPVLAKVQHLRWPPLPPKGQNRGTQRSNRSMAQRDHLPIQSAHRLPLELQVLPVHRLDRHTSGLMIFARTRQAEQSLITMFRQHTVRREYVGVCHGALQTQTIESWLVRDRGDGLRGSLPPDATPEQLESAQHAVPHILGCKPLDDTRYSLFRCRLETGRTHQIRIHLSEAGHRLCGEPLYIVDRAGNKLHDLSHAPRQALHSDRLAFVHPITHKPLQFEMPWPSDLAQWIRHLNQATRE
ncbi:MAG TPA: RluA family pseudouridine synthase [Planctomycetaceae bacterium]|nr:RluA family pseudouridine synthase [Planctomycetaceae bacterium]